MTGLMCVVAAAAGALVERPSLAFPKEYDFHLQVFTGDPLGSREEGTIRCVIDTKMVNLYGRPMFFLHGTMRPDPGFQVGPGSERYAAMMVEVAHYYQRRGIAHMEVKSTRRKPTLLNGIAAEVRETARPIEVGRTIRFRIAADSPSDQIWAELTLRPAK